MEKQNCLTLGVPCDLLRECLPSVVFSSASSIAKRLPCDSSVIRPDVKIRLSRATQARRKEKDVSSMFGEDITGNVGLTVSRSADIVVGYGRKNPNSARGRERRGKKGVKKRL